MDGGRYKVEHAALPGRRRSSCLLHAERHGEAFIEHAKLAVRRRLVRRIHEDATIEQGPMHVRNHASNVSERSRLATSFREFALLDVGCDGGVPLGCVSFIHGVNRSLLRNTDVRVGEDEFSKLWVQGVTVDTFACRVHEHGAAAIHGVAGCHHFSAWAECILRLHICEVVDAVDAEDCTNGDPTVDVRASVERIEHDAVLPPARRLNNERFFVLFRNHEANLSGGLQGVDENLVGNHV
mmetsp:Transcript_58828/g.138566  ORF Transcript_58828/g.138566 Transcript_58828/m.138566 type:complete len:239 (-) Transcript_58828:245-961(-)